MPKGLFLPVDRRDLLEVLDMQDSIADTAQDIAGLLVTRTMTVPDDMQADLRTLVERCVEACNQSATIVNEDGTAEGTILFMRNVPGGCEAMTPEFKAKFDADFERFIASIRAAN